MGVREFGPIIGGRQLEGSQWLDVVNPYTSAAVGRVATVSAEALESALSDTHSATIQLTRHERGELLNRMAQAVEERRGEISTLITDESGLCLKDTAYEVGRVSDVLRFSAMKALDDDSEVFPCDVSEHGRSRRIYTSRYPLDLVAAITPFNHPMNQVAHKIAPAIATNNTVLLKPSEKTPLSAYYLAELALECGLPPHGLNVINTATRDLSEALVRSELVDLITFTGSSTVGRRLADISGYKRMILELGGSSPLLVLEDAEVTQAVDIAVAGIFKNSGQRCTAIRRLLVHSSIVENFAQQLAARVAELNWGDPYDVDTDMGTVIDEEAASLIEARVAESVATGARILTGNERRGALFSPTVLDRVRNDHALVASETFGPVAPVISFDTLDEAIAIANDTPYGLSGGVVSDHWPSIQRVIGALNCGTVNVNEAPSYRLEWTPFGGIKASGLGYKEGVIETMKAMTYVKTYSLPWDHP
jgi:aldehyde dehydrogenase (NAD+)